MQTHRVCFAFLAAFVLTFLLGICIGQENRQLTVEQQREFLLNAKVIGARESEKGITNSYRLTLSIFSR
jgi:hypothetical protein